MTARLAALLVLAAIATLSAHEIPRDVVVHAFVKPEGVRARVVLRVPLAALRDIQWPETATGNLDVERAKPLVGDGIATWILPSLELREAGVPAGPPELRAFNITSPAGGAFRTFDDAFALATAETARDPLVPPAQALVDLLIDFPIASERSAFAIRPGFERLGVRVLTSLRFVSPDGEVRAFELHGDPGVVYLDPRWHQAARRFVVSGFFHILEGVDHLLFLACLVIPFRRVRPLIIVVTAFTASHSVALIAAALGAVPQALWFPPLIETLIAASVLYMAIENVLRDGAPRHRAVLAFAFGLLHGFGFSFALQDTMQFAGAHLVTSLFAFNLGVELGQIAVLVLLVPALTLLFRRVRERRAVVVMSLLAAQVAFYWMTERWSAFREFPFPQPGGPELLLAVRIAIVILAAFGGVWAYRAVRRRRLTFGFAQKEPPAQ